MRDLALLALALVIGTMAIGTGCRRDDPVKAPRRPAARKTTSATVPAEGVEAKVIEIVSEQFRVRASQITRATRLKDDLKADDLDQVELVMEIEDVFGLSISDPDAEKLRTVGQVIDYVQAHRKPSPASSPTAPWP